MNDLQKSVRICQRLLVSVLTVMIAVTAHCEEPSAIPNAAPDADGERFFVEKIQPLLESRCLACHSHAAGEMEGGLTLDSRSGWQQGGDRGPSIIPGKPDESLLISAIRRTNPDLQMPPDEELSPSEIALLTTWIAEGAADPRTPPADSVNASDPLDWWSLRPLNRPEVPAIRGNESHTGNVIDAFIHRRLAEQGLSAAPRADRRTLIRRLYFDLHGLPPTPDDVAAFVSDSDPQAYRKLVDRLLNSDRYGERWARHWLDTVHFADSHGCEHDALRPNAWQYRDYVIESLNRDTPWDRFIREQLAADWFYPDEPELTRAMGFIAAGPLELSRAGTAPVTFDYLDRDDMVTQTMASFASVTANCARCHDHKFDPISQEDYYSLQAVFAGTGKGDVEFDADPGVADSRRHWNALLAAAARNDPAVLLAAEHEAVVGQWEQEFHQSPAVWEPLAPSEFLSSDGATLTLLDDKSILASGMRPEQDTYTITTSSSLQTLTAVRLEVLADDSLPMKGPGRQDNGNLHLSEFEVFLSDDESDQPMRLPIKHAAADWDQAGWTIAHAVDGDPATAWGIYPKVGHSHSAVFQLETPQTLRPSSRIMVVLKQLHGGGHLIGRPKIYATDAPDAMAEVLPELLRSALSVPRNERSTQQQLAIAARALKIHAEQKLSELPAPSTVYAVSAGYSHGKKLPSVMSPKVVHVLKRGDIQKPGKVASSGALSAIAGLPGRFELSDPDNEASRRAALADWLAAEQNPLTWRSVVNRMWSHHFGRGLCDTPNDFGRMGGVPSHPELLDWLAVWFRDDAQESLKQLHRMILLSSTYQQTSHIDIVNAVTNSPRNEGKTPTDRKGKAPAESDQEGEAPTESYREGEAPAEPPAEDSQPNASPALASSRDAQNRLLWRMSRRRLDAESFRDAILQISDRIDLTMGGPGVQQFTQSTGSQLTPKLHYDAFDWNDATAARRSIYRVVWRGIADPFMESLDFPDLGLLAPKRGHSVSALQALTVFNNDFVLHHSQHLARSLKASHETTDEQVLQACRLIFLRDPDSGEAKLLAEYAQTHGLAAMCRVLFNSNEFLYVN